MDPLGTTPVACATIQPMEPSGGGGCSSCHTTRRPCTVPLHQQQRPSIIAAVINCLPSLTGRCASALGLHTNTASSPTARQPPRANRPPHSPSALLTRTCLFSVTFHDFSPPVPSHLPRRLWLKKSENSSQKWVHRIVDLEAPQECPDKTRVPGVHPPRPFISRARARTW